MTKQNNTELREQLDSIFRLYNIDPSAIDKIMRLITQTVNAKLDAVLGELPDMLEAGADTPAGDRNLGFNIALDKFTAIIEGAKE